MQNRLHGEKGEINSIQVEEISMQVFTKMLPTNVECTYAINIKRHIVASNNNTQAWIKENTHSKLSA